MQELRNILKKNDKITLYNSNGASFTFEITGDKSIEGGFCVCYIATLDHKAGRLKEFYPSSNEYELERNLNNNYLHTKDDLKDYFAKSCNRYVEKYNLLKNVEKTREGLEPFSSFIPNSEIYYAKENDELKGVYVWTPADATGVTYYDYLKGLKEASDHNANTLYFIVKCMITLCKNIISLHDHKILHLDIKPENFMIKKDASGQLSSESLSLFDIDSFEFKSYDKVFGARTYSKYYSAPELGINASSMCDVYSIGATFYESLCLKWYNQTDLREDIKKSIILNASEFYNEEKIINSIKNILEQTMCFRDNRYKSVKELKDNFEALLEMMEDCKREMEKNIVYDMDRAFINLLYTHPLYETVKPNEKEINILLFGSGYISRKFLDHLLQVGFMPMYKVNIDVYAKDIDDIKEYLQNRKGLEQFVNIENIKNSNKTSNIKLNFVEKHFKYPKPSKYINRIYQKKRYHYVFISLDDDSFNRNLFNDLNYEEYTNVFYVNEHLRKKNEKSEVCVQEGTVEKMSSDLMRTAFNTHLIWSGKTHVSLKSEYEDFKKDYNLNSSLMFALSLRYKLYSIGLTENNAKELAANVKEIIDNEQYEKINPLIWVEHQRWNIEKITAGWTGPDNIDEYIQYCIENSTVKDGVNHIHPCIVSSDICTHYTREEFLEELHKEVWDTSFLRFDELDQVSIKLHRAFKADANYKISNRESLELFIKRLIEQVGNKTTNHIKLELNNYIYAIHQVLEKDAYYSKHFGKIQNTLLELVKQANYKVEDFEYIVDKIHQFLFTIIESNLYRDYKEYDIQLIEKIPFILTYQSTNHEKQNGLMLAYQDGKDVEHKNEVLFGNVASATVIKPNIIYYQYFIKQSFDLNWFIHTVEGMLKYLEGCRVCFDLYYLQDVPENIKHQVDRFLNKYHHHPVMSVNGFECSDLRNVIQKIEDRIEILQIDLIDGSTALFEEEDAEKEYQKMIQAKKHFEYNWETKKFINCRGCEELHYIPQHQTLRVEQILHLMNKDVKGYLPDLKSDYFKLFEIYEKALLTSENQTNYFTELCENINANTVSKVVKIFRDDCKKTKTLNVKDATNAKVLLNNLILYELIGPDSKIHLKNAERWSLEIVSNGYQIDEIAKLFKNNFCLVNAKRIEVQKFENVCDVKFSSLEVCDLSYDENQKEVLEVLTDLGFIYLEDDLEDNDECSFEFGSDMMKKLLVDPCGILKQYVYYQSKNLHFFDDIQCGDFDTVDCIMTKNFATLFVACVKPGQSLNEVCCKLKEFSNSIGIANRKVIIAPMMKQVDVIDNDTVLITDLKEIKMIADILKQNFV